MNNYEQRFWAILWINNRRGPLLGPYRNRDVALIKARQWRSLFEMPGKKVGFSISSARTPTGGAA